MLNAHISIVLNCDCGSTAYFYIVVKQWQMWLQLRTTL